MTPAMDPCPYATKKERGRHCLSLLVPESSKDPATLFCDRCGMTKHVRVDFPMPVDDMVADAIKAVTHG